MDKYIEFLNKEITVDNLDNYKTNYAEILPFRGVIYDISDYPEYYVKSLITGKQYELYDYQIVEIRDKYNLQSD